jgi:hypothetical protein
MFDIYSQIFDREIGNFFLHPSLVALRHPFWVSNYSDSCFEATTLRSSTTPKSSTNDLGRELCYRVAL